MLNGSSEKTSDIVPVLLNGSRKERMVGVPIFFQIISKDVEHLIVDVLVDTCSPFETVNDQP